MFSLVQFSPELGARLRRPCVAMSAQALPSCHTVALMTVTDGSLANISTPCHVLLPTTPGLPGGPPIVAGFRSAAGTGAVTAYLCDWCVCVYGWWQTHGAARSGKGLDHHTSAAARAHTQRQGETDRRICTETDRRRVRCVHTIYTSASLNLHVCTSASLTIYTSASLIIYTSASLSTIYTSASLSTLHGRV